MTPEQRPNPGTYSLRRDAAGNLVPSPAESAPQQPAEQPYRATASVRMPGVPHPTAEAYQPPAAPAAPRQSTPSERTPKPRRRNILLAAGLALGMAAGVAGFTVHQYKKEHSYSAGYDFGPEDSDMRVPAEFNKDQAESVIGKGDWRYTPGITPTDRGLEVVPTGMAILNLPEDAAGRPPRSGKYSPNQPLNLMSHVELDKPGEVGIAAYLTEVDKSATLTFAAAPPLRFDERTVHEKQVSVRVTMDSFTISHIDSRGAQPEVFKPIKRATFNNAAEVVVIQRDGELVVSVDGQAYKLPGDYFDRQVWFGADGKATIAELNAYPLGDNEVTVTDPVDHLKGVKQTKDGLYGTAEANGYGDRKFSTAIDLTELMGNPAYAKFVIENFNQLEPSMAGKFQALQPKEGVFTFDELDAIVKFANHHNMEVHGHTLDFTEAYPKWLQDKLRSPETSKAEAQALLEKHITTVMQHYDGKDGRPKIDRWDVVNEPFDPDNYERLNAKNIWAEKLGTNHIRIALAAARKANPDALLYLNEWGETDEDRRNAVYSLAKQLASEGILDGVAFQGHWFGEDLEDRDVLSELFDGTIENYMRKLAALKNHKGENLRVRISEASVATDGGEAMKARVYGHMLRMMMNIPSGDFGVWGAANKEDYMTAAGKPGGDLGDDAIARQPKFRTGPVETNSAYQHLLGAVTKN
ncbi:MAG TPA: endo-1,4-beta-xylanase [Candidatus Saccharimonadales bacterium]|nr:endo-1,4-beta-xylanase [Candidatus Saccharimonadales bacterium]